MFDDIIVTNKKVNVIDSGPLYYLMREEHPDGTRIVFY